MTATREAQMARVGMFDFVQQHGVAYRAKVVDVTGPYHECWTNAWRAALDTGRVYVEGLCMLRGKPYAHAWTVDEAGIVYEHTEGWEKAGAYVGFEIDTSAGSNAARLVERTFDGDSNGSIIEGLIAAGLTGHRPVDLVAFLTNAREMWRG